jgi:hypothetical protein
VANRPEIGYEELLRLANGRAVADTPCPACSDLRQRRNRRKPVLRIWTDVGFASYCCQHCGAKGYAHDGTKQVFTDADRQRFAERKAQAEALHAQNVRERRSTARWLWGKGIPAAGTIVATYLGTRALAAIPPTIRFLPPRGEYHPAMISAFGMAIEPAGEEIEPGNLIIPDDAVMGVHLTLLKPDGSGKADTEKQKIIIGMAVTEPIILAPLSDALALTITEGIEEAITHHEVLGTGAWAAGCASRLPGIAAWVPDYCDCVRLVVDGDEAGLRFSRELYRRLQARGLHIEPIILPAKEIAA